MRMKKEKIKPLYKLKKNDIVYVLDYKKLDEGFKECKVINSSHKKSTYWDCCGYKDIEYWSIKIDTPYLERFINVYKTNENSCTFKFSYPSKIDEDSNITLEQVTLIIGTSKENCLGEAKDYIKTNIEYLNTNITDIEHNIQNMQLKNEFNKVELNNYITLSKKLENISLL